MASLSTNTVTFKVIRQKPELLPPAKPTPHEIKPLSDIDDQGELRSYSPIIQFYRKNPSMEGKDSVKIIRDAVAKALVFYYPFAGRLREYAARKLVVECTGEGVVFVEADADVTLQQFGGDIHPPFPYLKELIYDVPGSAGVINCPLLVIQVTRLKCGGFIFALRLNHTMSDATGIVQFLSSVCELARGAFAPSIQPVWQRHLLNARYSPRVSYTHHEYDVLPNTEGTLLSLHNVVRRSFFFSATDVSALRRSLPPHLRHFSKFELVAASVWRCRIIALSPNPNEEVRLICIVNIRNRFNPPLPEGYYGNAIVYPVVITTVEKLSKNPLHYALELVRETKSKATEEYVKSVADLMVIRGRPKVTFVRTYMVSDLMHAGFDKLDFGWGKPEFGGSANGASGVVSFFMPFKNSKGEEGVLVPVGLPRNAMEVFAKELEMMMTAARKSSILNASAL